MTLNWTKKENKQYEINLRLWQISKAHYNENKNLALNRWRGLSVALTEVWDVRDRSNVGRPVCPEIYLVRKSILNVVIHILHGTYTTITPSVNYLVFFNVLKMYSALPRRQTQI
jgi:hypothetical protein